MSSERSRETKDLAICISNPQSSYKPGDTISGRVFRQVPVLIGAEDVTVTIQLMGRANAKITEWSDHMGESQRSSTSCFNLFAPDDILQTLHRGPLHTPRMVSGLADDELELRDYEEVVGQSWPFSFIIPRHTSASSGQYLDAGGRSDHEAFRRYTFIPVDKNGLVAAHALPSSLYIQRREYGPGQFLSGYIEYFLQAHLISAHSNNKSTAVAPITIYNNPIPTVNNVELQLSQSAIICGKSFWKKGTEIRFEVGTPSTSRLDHRGPLPFAIRAMWPSPNDISKAKPLPRDPIIRIKALSITLNATNTVWASRPDTPSRSDTLPKRHFAVASHRETHHLHTVIFPEWQMSDQTCVPFGLHKQPLDLGQILSVQMQAGTTDVRSRAGGDQAMSGLPHSFQTFNMKCCYKLVWEVILDVAGKHVKLEGKTGISLL